MPTRYARISVVRDPELGDALHATREQLSGTSEAARLRELALIGARSLTPDTGGAQARARLQAQFGARPATGDLLVAARAARRGGREGGESASESLDWVRGPR